MPKSLSNIQKLSIVLAISFTIGFVYFFIVVNPDIDLRFRDGTLSIDEFYWYEYFLVITLMSFSSAFFVMYDALKEARYKWIWLSGAFIYPAFYYLFYIYKQNNGEDSSLNITKTKNET